MQKGFDDWREIKHFSLFVKAEAANHTNQHSHSCPRGYLEKKIAVLGT